MSDKLLSVIERLRKKGVLTEEDVSSALREIRVALLEADVALSVVKTFIQNVKEKALGAHVVSSVSPAHMVVKIVHDELVSLLSKGDKGLNFSVTPPAVMMLVGLQGSGKTTTTAKLGKFLKEKLKKKVLFVSLDVYRPAAQKQLEVLAKTLSMDSLSIIEGEFPLAITKRALLEARLGSFDVVLLDTAGRLHVDEALMEELTLISKSASPSETLLVVDAMMGQDAVHVAESFQDKLNLTGLILTRLDGDARGGAALSISSITGKPIKFVGMGEKLDHWDVFHPDRVAGRVLGQGDVVGLVEKAMETLDKESSDALSKRIERGSFDLTDMEKHLSQVLKLGGVGFLAKMIPGLARAESEMSQSGVSDIMVRKQIAIIHSMTPQERRHVRILNASRRRRIASGSGTTVQEVNRLLRQFDSMEQMVKRFGKLGTKGFLRSGLKGFPH